jgi:hypothetical protein
VVRLKVKLVKEGRRRKISQDILENITSSISPMLTPKWHKGEVPLKREKKFDVPQAWMNAVIKRLLVSAGFEAEVNPFSLERPASIEKRLSMTKKELKLQAVDFEKSCSNSKRHVVEVECGNVASLYRSIHKICMALREKEEAVGIIVVPNKELISRCDVASSMSSSEAAKVILSEYAYYHPETNEINLIEFSTDQEVNIVDLVDDTSYWKGRLTKAKGKYLDDNLNRFLKPITKPPGT